MTKSITRFLILMVPLCVPVEGAAQQGARTTEWPAVEQILRLFEARYRTNAQITTAGVSRILAFPDSFAPARVDSLLDGLERFAISSDHFSVQSMALITLSQAGMATSQRPIAGVASRLHRIHEQSTTPYVRDEAVTSLGMQAERGVAVAALLRIAVRDSAEQKSSEAALRAVWALTELGPEGEAALRRLHAQRLVREARARHSMSEIAIQRGWERRSRENH